MKSKEISDEDSEKLAAALLLKYREGVSTQDIIDELVEKGYPPNEVKKRVTNLTLIEERLGTPLNEIFNPEVDEAKEELGHGFLMMIVGAIVTFISWSVASAFGGIFVVMWGAVLAGAFFTIKGLVRILTRR